MWAGVLACGLWAGGCAAERNERAEVAARAPGASGAVAPKPTGTVPEGGAAVGVTESSVGAAGTEMSGPRMVVLGALPARGPIEAGVVAPAGESRAVLAAWPARDATRLLMLREVSGGGGAVRVRQAPVREGAIAADLGQLSELQLVVTGAGDLAVARSVERADDAATEFAPPMLLVPARLERGAKVEQTLTMTVRPLGEPTQVRNQGRATRRVEYVGDERVRVPAGEFDARHLRSVLEANLGGPEVRVTIDLWYADGVGLIAEDSRQVVRVLGLTVRQKSERWALRALDAAEAEALRAVP